MIHLAVPAVLVALLVGAGVYGMVARRHAVLVLIGAELVLNAAGLLLVTAATLPAGGLAQLSNQVGTTSGAASAGDPLVTGQVLAIFVVALAAAEIGLALAVILLLFRRTGSSDLTARPEADELPEAAGQPEAAS